MILAEAGDADGGGGGGGQAPAGQAPGGQAPGGQAPGGQAPGGQAPTGEAPKSIAEMLVSEDTTANAPVTLAQFNALAEKIDKLISGKAESPSATPGANASPDETPAWAQSMKAQLEALTEQSTRQTQGARRDALIKSVLDKVPAQQHGLAKLALHGVIGDAANIPADADLAKLAENVSASLRQQAPSLFTAPGSPHSAAQVGADGKVDWGRVRSFSDVPPDMIASMPDDVVRRISQGTGGNNDTVAVPRNI